MRVFIVDDSALVRRHVAEVVEGVAGAQVVGDAATAEQALAGIRDAAPDVIILDIAFPGGGGAGVLDALESHQPRPAVIVLTNYADPEHQRAFGRRGAAAFLDKTLEFDRLGPALERLSQPPA